MELNQSQAAQLLHFFGGCEASVTIKEVVDGHDGSGIYCYCTDYPEDGSIRLDPDATLTEEEAFKVWQSLQTWRISQIPQVSSLDTGVVVS